jgi:hypothetical protein
MITRGKPHLVGLGLLWDLNKPSIPVKGPRVVLISGYGELTGTDPRMVNRREGKRRVMKDLY